MRSSSLLSLQEAQYPSLVMAPIMDGTWRVPRVYSPAADAVDHEYAAAKNGVAIIDRSWRSAILAVGHDRGTFLQGMLTNDVLALQPGDGCLAALLDSKGRIQASMTVRCFPHTIALVCDPRCADVISETLERYIILEDVETVDESDQWVVLGLIGSGSAEFIEQEFNVAGVSHIPAFGTMAIGDIPASGVIADASVGNVEGYEVWLPIRDGSAAWERLVAAGAKPAGSEVDEILRVEAGVPSWGSEIDSNVLLPEIGAETWASFTKGCYIGQEIVARIDARGHTNRALRGFVFEDCGVEVQPGTRWVAPADPTQEVCRLTSSVRSPGEGGKYVGLGFVRKEFDLPGVLQEWQSPTGDVVGVTVRGAQPSLLTSA